MKTLLLALNAKFIHTSLALRYIKEYCKPHHEDIKIIEATINHSENEIIKDIYKYNPDIIGISCYIWNMQLVKALIPTIKKVLPNATIILGGPEVSYEGEELLNKCDADIIMQGEGEQTWLDYLNYKTTGIPTLNQIDGIIYKSGDIITKNKPRKPLDLNNLPFVYETLVGLENKIIYYEASRGCPFNCQYCLSSADKGVRFVPIDKVKEHMLFFIKNRVKQVKFIDRTFNTDRKYATEIWKYLIDNDNGYTNFHFEIAAELINDSALNELEHARKGLIQFEIGVQSTNPKVLDTIDRNMPYEDIRKISTKIREMKNIHQHLDLIAGLPHEDYISFANSFNDVIALRPEQFQLGFLKLLKGSGLRKNADKYGLVYKNEPPYEILYTKELSYGEMIRIHSIEELVERYYNTNRFVNSLEYLFVCFKSPFEFFERLTDYWDENEYDKIQHNKLSYYKHLLSFSTKFQNVDSSVLMEYLKLDYILHEKPKEIPEFLNGINNDTNRKQYSSLLKDDEFIQTHLPHMLELSPRERGKITHMEYFKYNIWENYLNNNYSNHKLIDEYIILDYAMLPPKGSIIPKEYL